MSLVALLFAWPYMFLSNNISYKSQKFLFSIWVAEPASLDSRCRTLLPDNHCELLSTFGASTLPFGRFFYAFVAEIVIAIVWAGSVSNFIFADAAWVFSLFDDVHDLLLLFQVDGVKHCLMLSKLIEDVFLFLSQHVHLFLALVYNSCLLHELFEGIICIV
jgi:hypothetical protein